MYKNLLRWRQAMLEGAKVRLRPVKDSDWDIYGAWNNDAEVTVGQNDLFMPFNADQLENLFKMWRVEDPASGFTCTIETLDGQVVGTITIYGIKSPVRCATLGITIAPGHQNRGYGREALLIALRLAFEEYNAHKVELEVYDYNQRAIGLYESVGFVTEGCRREVVYHMGRYFDRILMGILESEWRQRQDIAPACDA